MHFHLPEPTHGWREFVGEVGIIVLGVLIALGFEQLVQEIQWSDTVRKAHANIGTETELANYFFGFRTAASPCVERRLVSINDVIENVASNKPVGRLESIGPDIGAGLSDSNWQAERAAQTLTHFDKRELDQLGGYYHQLDSVADAVFREDAAWSELRVLEGDPSRLGAEDIAGLRRSLQHARFENYLISGISRQQLRMAKQLKLTIPTARVKRLNTVWAKRLRAVCAPLSIKQ
jgi:hypothetical protein